MADDDRVPPTSQQGGGPRSIFVRNLPFDLSDKELEACFEEVGPVRECWAVRRKGQAGNSGTAFVKFALAEDAARAVTEKTGMLVKDRRIVVDFAKQRPALADRVAKRRKDGTEGGEKGEHQVKTKSTLFGGGEAGRTVILGGFSAETAKVVTKLVRKQGGEHVSRIDYPAPAERLPLAEIRSMGCRGSVALIAFSSRKAAETAVVDLHRMRLERQQGKPTLWARMLGGEGASPQRWKVIVRNLPFTLSQAVLQSTMSKAGFVWDVTLPLTPEGKSRGFAFALYTRQKDAAKAVRELNGTDMGGRTVAVDWALSKDKYQSAIGPGGDGEGEPKEKRENGESSDEEGDAGNKEAASGEGEEEGDEDEAPLQPPSEKERGTLLKAMQSVISMNSKKERKTAVNEAPQNPPLEEKQSGERRKTKMKSKKSDTTTNPATLFLRGLPPAASPRLVTLSLKKFGRVVSCRLVRDKITREPVGTAFVDMDSDAAVQACCKAASKSDGGVYVSGVKVTAAPALDAAAAKDLMGKIAKRKGGGGAPGGKKQRDKRNIYLLEEGRILEDSPAASGISKHDLIMRQRSWKERQTQLSSPDFYINPIRLVVRNLPIKMKDKQFSTFCRDAVLARATKAKPDIKKAKILYDKTKANPDGILRSRGIGFVEFSTHEHALTAMRHMNNNPELFGPDRRPVVEFAVENVKKKKQMEAKRRRVAESQREQKTKMQKLSA